MRTEKQYVFTPADVTRLTNESSMIFMDQRLEQAHSWLQKHLADQHFSITLLSGDASFRRYFRVTTSGGSYALMDAPPHQEDSKPFVTIGHCWRDQGIQVPQIFAEDLANGFLLLEDFGDNTFFRALTKDPDNYYRKAIDALIPIQFARPADSYLLPAFDEKLLRFELSLFTDWLLTRKLGLQLTEQEQLTLQGFFDQLVSNALQQPIINVHRDFHSRNLMVKTDNTLGILDFQDAVMGPVSYDLVSLLRDCYIKWPRDKVSQWRSYYLEQLRIRQGILYNEKDFSRWFDLTGMQRHLKAAGIFA
jgi:aminoglycoside/choline kinase family phosphotransferase